MQSYKIFILAGNRNEALRYINEAKISRSECFFIDSQNVPVGFHDIWVLCCGSWQQRQDLSMLMSYLNASNARLTEYHNGWYYTIPLQPVYRWSTQQNPYSWSGGQQTNMAIKCRIWWDSALNSYVLSGAYNSRLVEGLKATIPSGSRDHDPATKFWYFQEQYGEFVRQMAEAAFGVGSVSFTSRNVTQQAGSQQGQQAYQAGSRPTTPASLNGSGTTEDAIIAFMNLVPYEAAKRCYLGASATLHPDKPTGDPQKMSKLNQLWERIEKEFYKR